MTVSKDEGVEVVLSLHLLIPGKHNDDVVHSLPMDWTLTRGTVEHWIVHLLGGQLQRWGTLCHSRSCSRHSLWHASALQAAQFLQAMGLYDKTIKA